MTRERGIRAGWTYFVAAVVIIWSPGICSAQDLFEIQVYPYETVEPHHTMFEFHFIAFPSGTKAAEKGMFPTHHQFHITAEITHGLSKHWELGGYLVSAFVPDEGARFAGARLRPRFRLEESKRLPFRIGLSVELDFNKHEFDTNTITLEIRPIIEKESGKWYLAVNPDFTKSFRGEDAHRGFGMEPGVKVSYKLTKRIEPGFEYYAETGPVASFDKPHDQHHLVFPTLDINTSPDWEINIGVGRGFTGTSQHWVVKWIIGRKFRF